MKYVMCENQVLRSTSERPGLVAESLAKTRNLQNPCLLTSGAALSTTITPTQLRMSSSDEMSTTESFSSSATEEDTLENLGNPWFCNTPRRVNNEDASFPMNSEELSEEECDLTIHSDENDSDADDMDISDDSFITDDEGDTHSPEPWEEAEKVKNFDVFWSTVIDYLKKLKYTDFSKKAKKVLFMDLCKDLDDSDVFDEESVQNMWRICFKNAWSDNLEFIINACKKWMNTYDWEGPVNRTREYLPRECKKR